MFDTVLIANRGEIACRLARTLRRMNIRSVAVYSEPDRNSLHVSVADVALPLGGQSASDSYLRADLIIAAAHRSGAQAILPGYGFLSENAAFAARCEAEGIAFIGPTPEQMAAFGLKHAARELAAASDVPLVPGSGLLADAAAARAAARDIGYPVMLKSTAGGGGIGLVQCDDDHALDAAFESVQRLGEAFFADAGVFVERFVDNARHIEVQIFGDGKGNVVVLGDRDCSVQRRHQKLIEETPAPHLPAVVRERMLSAAAALGRAVQYRSAGTVEFIYDPARENFYFLEVNTRLQVEHGITELVTGIDLVEWMIRIAAGQKLAALCEPLGLHGLRVPSTSRAAERNVVTNGTAIEVRLYAENPLRQFTPSPGTLTEVVFPGAGARVDSWVESGCEVSPHYDSLLAKIMVHAADRATAIAKMIDALDATRLFGIATNLDYLRHLLRTERFQTGNVSTRFLDDFCYLPDAIEVIAAGTFTTVQDYPGRTGYWGIGVPPSGPMDDWAFRVGNRIVGNQSAAAGLEATLSGPTLRFHCDAVIALTGAPTEGDLDGKPLTFWSPMAVKAGQVLRIGRVRSGCRTYLNVRGGIDVPLYLGSRSTFVLAGFGGHAGRILRVADVLMLAAPTSGDDSTRAARETTPSGIPETSPAPLSAPSPFPARDIPTYETTWHIGVLHGPHGAPDFFTHASVDAFLAVDWQVHYQSSRLGIRLSGPKPQWARLDGGEAGLHPSNIHDCEYAIGSINVTGDMPVILTRDGPSLGGFVCPLTIAKVELWKVGQLKPGDLIRFHAMTFDEALALERSRDALLDDWDASLDEGSALLDDADAVGTPLDAWTPDGAALATSAVLHQASRFGDRPKIVVRQAGDNYLLLEYGDDTLDLNDRFRIHALMEALKQHAITGVCELAPGVRSLQIRYDGRAIHQRALVDALVSIDATLQNVRTMRINSRVLHLPLAYEDAATLEAVARYQQLVRSDAPWLPSNTEFIRRINGLPTRDAVRDTIFSTRYLVLGLGDVYLGAPCAVPIDPRSRLLTSKYNPARTHTSEGTVGIGGVYMCIYGMDSPGGYQLVGRTLPIWNTFLKHPLFVDQKPWLLRYFDQIQFYPVDERTLETMRNDFREGRHAIRIDEDVFDLGRYNAFLEQIEPELRAFRARQKAAFDAEVARWATTTDTLPSTDRAAFSHENVRDTVHRHAPAMRRDTNVIADSIGHLGHLGQTVPHVVDDSERERSMTNAVVDGVDGVECTMVSSDMTGNVWRVIALPGTAVQAGDTLLVLEAMKMEFPVLAPHDGIVDALYCQLGKTINAGERLVSLVSKINR